jgi:flavin-dependent dehydrogenase
LNSYDCVVAGGGFAGLAFAGELADRGADVLVLDDSQRDLDGMPCFVDSDAIGSFDGLPAHELSGIDIADPDTATVVPAGPAGFKVVDGGRLLSLLEERAIASGAEVVKRSRVIGAGTRRGRVISVATERATFPCSLALDSTGGDRVLSRSLPGGMGVPRRIKASDHYRFHQEAREAGDATEEGPGRGRLTIHMSRYGGFGWSYRTDDVIVVASAVQDRVGAPDPREVVHGYCRSNPWIGEGVLAVEGGRIAVRRPLDSMATPGMLIAGAAACQSGPFFMLRGVGESINASRLAAEVASSAIESGETSLAALWRYNSGYMRGPGARAAALDCVRVFLQHISEKDLSWSITRGLIDSQEMSGAIRGRLEVPGAQARMVNLVRGLTEMPTLVRFQNALKLAQKIQEIYERYPVAYEPDEYAEWLEKTGYLFEDSARL